MLHTSPKTAPISHKALTQHSLLILLQMHTVPLLFSNSQAIFPPRRLCFIFIADPVKCLAVTL